MNKIVFVLISLGALVSCSGQRYFDKPSDFVGGNRAVAVETHCAREAGAGGPTKDNVMYKLCEQSYITHYEK